MRPARQPRLAHGAGVGGGLRLHIDWTTCDGRGLCTELVPELLGRDEWGYPMPRGGVRGPLVGPELRVHAERAVHACPVLALRLLPA